MIRRPHAELVVPAAVAVVDCSGGTLGLRKFLNGNGVSPSITTIPNRELAAGIEVPSGQIDRGDIIVSRRR